MDNYLAIAKEILREGDLVEKERTGDGMKMITGAFFKHDMSKGFPLGTSKKLSLEKIAGELKFYLEGLTDKRILQERYKCNFWDDWCNPQLLESKYTFKLENVEDEFNRINQEYLNEYKNRKARLKFRRKLKNIKSFFEEKENGYVFDPEKITSPEVEKKFLKDIKEFAQFVERDLGPIYGFQWRHNCAEYIDGNCDAQTYKGKGYDQIKEAVRMLKEEPYSRRNFVDTWCAPAKDQMAVDPCITGFQLDATNGKLNLYWNQRSCDTMIGLHADIAEMGLLLHLFAKEVNLPEGDLVGHTNNTHIYKPHLDQAEDLVMRVPYNSPIIKTDNFTSIFDWQPEDSKIYSYMSHPPMKFKISV